MSWQWQWLLRNTGCSWRPEQKPDTANAQQYRQLIPAVSRELYVGVMKFVFFICIHRIWGSACMSQGKLFLLMRVLHVWIVQRTAFCLLRLLLFCAPKSYRCFQVWCCQNYPEHTPTHSRRNTTTCTHTTSQLEEVSECMKGQLGLISQYVCVFACVAIAERWFNFNGFNETHSPNHTI